MLVLTVLFFLERKCPVVLFRDLRMRGIVPSTVAVYKTTMYCIEHELLLQCS